MLPYPIEKRVAEIKRDYPAAILFDIEDIDKGDVFYIVARPLTMREVGQAVEIANRDQDTAEEWVFQTSFSLAYSLTFDVEVEAERLPMGVTKQLFNIVMENSSMMELEPFLIALSSFREVHNTVFYEGARYVMKAFPQYKIKDIKELTRTEFAELIMLAEHVHGQPFQIVDPSMQVSEEQQNNKLIRKIDKEAVVNDNYLDFGKDNEDLRRQM